MPRLCQVALGALAHVHRNVAAEHLKKVLDGFIGAEVSQPFDCPESGLLLRFADVGDQQLVNAFWLDPAIGSIPNSHAAQGRLLGMDSADRIFDPQFHRSLLDC
jgi:hypothetical protein